ncbi:MAG: family 43 glycosylhydrolase [Myxococcales bacterium]|nr:family 43 glycosylhydrolase [Myxococcales bacterium]
MSSRRAEFVGILIAAASAAVAIGCDASGPGRSFATPIVYEPNTVLDIPTIVDVDGSPDIADPHVIKIGGTWYLYATQAKSNLEVWTSTDLKHWTNAGVVWTSTPGTWNAKGQAWAPHVEPVDGGFYLYYTAHMRIGVAWSASPLGPFEEILDHPLVGDGFGGHGDGRLFFDGTPLEALDFDDFAIDAFLLQVSDGSLVLYFTGYTPLSVTYAVPMTDFTTVAGVAPRVVLQPELFTWEGLGMEGTWVIERDGRFYNMYSANFAITQDYGLGVAVSDSPFGPFERQADNPVLRKVPELDFWGPGHHGVAPGAFGDLLVFYHTKVMPEPGYDRRIRYTTMRFDEGGAIRIDGPVAP